MSKLELLNLELEKAELEKENLITMSEQVACSMYKVDYKAEAMTLIDEDIIVLKSLIVDELDKLN